MKKMIKSAIMVLTILMLCAPAMADAPQWEIDHAHSSVYFSITHIFATVRGTFDDFSGRLRFSPDDPASSRCDFEITVNSINTDNPKRDAHLNSEEFFDSEKFPKMTFTSTAVRHVKDNQYLVDGRMTIKDVSKDISVPFTLLGIKPNPFDKSALVAGFEARLPIDRLAYHVGSGKFFNMGVLGKRVDVLITIEASQKK